jgi:hypothetical protein
LAVTEMDMKRPSTWDRKILRRIHGPVAEQVIWGIRKSYVLRNCIHI